MIASSNWALVSANDETRVGNHREPLLKAVGEFAKIAVCWMTMRPDECGERNILHATAQCYTPRATASERTNRRVIAIGADGNKSSGVSFVDWYGEAIGK